MSRRNQGLLAEKLQDRCEEDGHRRGNISKRIGKSIPRWFVQIVRLDVTILVVLLHISQRGINHTSQSGAFPDQLEVPVALWLDAIVEDVQLLLLTASEVFIQLLVR
jgi:hypothetical protein